MLLPQIIAALSVAALVYCVKLVWTANKSPLSRIPGPWYARYSQIPLRYYSFTARRIFYVDDLHKKYGKVVRIGPNEVAVADLEGVSKIHNFGSGFHKSKFYEDLSPDRAPGIFAMRDPYAHGARRKLFARALNYSSLKANWSAQVKKYAETAVQKIKQDASGTKGANLLHWWTLMASDVIAHLNFGESFGMLELGEQTEYVKALQNSPPRWVMRAELPLLFKILPYVPSKRVQDFLAQDDLIDSYGARAIENMRSGNRNTTNIFGQMLAATDSTEKVTLGDKDIKDEAGNLIIAGTDTTAITLTYLVWAVLKQPQLQARLEEEVAKISPEMNLEEVEPQAAPLLNSIIEETMRLYGAAPGLLPRTVPSQGATIGGHFLPGGVEVSTHAWTNHRDPTVFPDPLRFDGYRFMDKTTMTASQKAALMPWGGGSRICGGINLAYMELRLGAAFFFRECRGARIAESMTDEMMEMTNMFLITPKGHCCYVTLK
ncbi:cytochrome P450 [Paraphoma chrysanthemicola]|uniref:Cytochrome P450 n=1 Tax=Paraphoma chrysanthemicola TaxID=798071 RepID=A0A8K0R5J2_9PLEO|nr:cytochrome P450 [Paraphoma chrysanthemicola]